MDVGPPLLERPGQYLLKVFMSKIKSLFIFVLYFGNFLLPSLSQVERNNSSKNWNIIFEAFLFGSTFSTTNWWDTRESKKKD